MPVLTLPTIAKLVGFEGQSLDIHYYLTHDYDDVSEAAMELPAVMELLNELRQHYIEQRHAAERELSRVKGVTYFELKDEKGEDNFAANYPGKPTEDALKMAVAIDSKVREADETYAVADAMVIRLYGTIDALRSRIELLRSSEATRRSVFSETTPR